MPGRQILVRDNYAGEVRAAEQLWQSLGIIDDRYLISGGRSPETFEKVLRQIAGDA